jgi:hypothetical protein
LLDGAIDTHPEWIQPWSATWITTSYEMRFRGMKIYEKPIDFDVNYRGKGF